MFEFERFIIGPTKPLRIPTLDAGDFSLDGGDPELAVGIALVRGSLQKGGEFVGVLSHALSEPRGHGTTIRPSLHDRPTDRSAFVRSSIPLIGPVVAFIRSEVALIGPAVTFSGDVVALVGSGLGLVGDAVAIVGGRVALVGRTITLIGRGGAPIRGVLTFIQDPVPAAGQAIASFSGCFPFVGEAVALVGGYFPFVGEAVALVGGCFPFVGDAVALVGGAVPLIRPVHFSHPQIFAPPLCRRRRDQPLALIFRYCFWRIPVETGPISSPAIVPSERMKNVAGAPSTP